MLLGLPHRTAAAANARLGRGKGIDASDIDIILYIEPISVIMYNIHVVIGHLACKAFLAALNLSREGLPVCFWCYMCM